jgi:hypothetical protein
MKSRALDSDGDWQFGRGLQSYVTEANALKQNILTRLRQWKGDCFFATTEGVDYNNYLDIGRKNDLDRDIKRVILQTAGVLRISDFTSTLNRDSRNVTISLQVSTIFGTLTFGNQEV